LDRRRSHRRHSLPPRRDAAGAAHRSTGAHLRESRAAPDHGELARAVSELTMETSEPVSSRRRIIRRTIGVVILVSAAATSIYACRVSFVNPRTDDAAVRANIVGIAPHVSGPIVDLRVADNQYVKQGDLLFVVDCRPYEARLARARADLAL